MHEVDLYSTRFWWLAWRVDGKGNANVPWPFASAVGVVVLYVFFHSHRVYVAKLAVES